LAKTTITILHPGDMGVSVAAAAMSAGNRVLWVAAGRGPDTRSRAEAAGLTAVETLAQALSESQAVLSVCPPHAALDTAREVAAERFSGLFVDGNAVSPATTDQVGGIVEAAGARFVDGGIIGLPATRAGTTRLYLAGPHAREAAVLFQGSLLDARVLDGPANGASALKMCYAAWTKGTTALLADIRALAAALDVESSLIEEWDLSQSGLAARSEAATRGNAFKAWRWVAEMHEIADSFEDAGLPGGFHRAAAEVYERLEGFKSDRNPELAQVLSAMLRPGTG
jgi:3-hydroxyisobutyrate dehydrogenase-like beta-hydroxyacid dehydrogenase